MGIKKRLLIIISAAILLLCLSAIPAFAANAGPGLATVPEPIDPQSWQFSRDMTWDDWHSNTAFNWRIDGDKITPQSTKKGLLILVDFADKPFVVTNPKGSQQMGNPQIEGIDTEDLIEFWESFLNDPEDHFNNGLNRGITISEFWQENTQGRWKVELDACGVYRLPGYEFEYGGLVGQNSNDLPTGYTNRTTAELNASSVTLAIEAGIDMAKYDFAFILHSGGAESQIWEEAGYMMFPDQFNIAEEYTAKYRLDQMKAAGLVVPDSAYAWVAQHDPANGGDGRGIWASNRYVPWTSWWGASHLWSSTGSTNAIPGRPGFRLSQQGETNGCATFSHEFGHISTIVDNYGTDVNVRAYTGFWDLMCAGSMTGFGGNHTRYQIPNLNGGAIPTHMLTRTKLKLGFIDQSQLFNVNYTDLSNGTPVVTEIYSRTTPIGDQFAAIYPELAAINDKHKAGEAAIGLRLYGFTDKKPRILSSVDWESDTFGGNNRYDNYSIEVIDQVGYDSVNSDHGVMITKNRETLSESAPYSWLINAHPGGLDAVDFFTPEGPNGEPSTPQPFRNNDNNHLSAALFHAGVSVTPNDYGAEVLRTGQTNADVSIVVDEDGNIIPKSIADNTVNEYVDTYNGLHFYILDRLYSPGPYGGDILSYQVALRHNNGQAVDGELNVEQGNLRIAVPGKVATANFNITNTGTATDIVRVSFETNTDWEVTLLNNLYAIGAGETITVPLYVTIPEGVLEGELEALTLTLNASSETNAEKIGSATIDAAKLVANPENYGGLTLTTSTDFVQTGGEFTVNAKFQKTMESNAAILDFTYNTKTFAYKGFDTAPGVSFVSAEETDNGVRITVMVMDYNTTEYGDLKLEAKKSCKLDDAENNICLSANFVLRHADGSKEAVLETANTAVTTGPPAYEITKYDLVTLSDMIDVFGMKSTDSKWRVYQIFDFNDNGEIDISDVAFFSSQIGK